MAFAKKSRLRIGIAAAVVLLILVLYHVLFSSIAMKRIWLPMVKQHTGVDFQVEQCSVSLFSRRTFSAGAAATFNSAPPRNTLPAAAAAAVREVFRKSRRFMRTVLLRLQIHHFIFISGTSGFWSSSSSFRTISSVVRLYF